MNRILQWTSGIRMGGSACRRAGKRLCGKQRVLSSEVKEGVKVEHGSDQTELRRFASNEAGCDTRDAGSHEQTCMSVSAGK